MDDTPRWIPVFFGGAMFLMGALILGAMFGLVPTGDGQFLAPDLVIAALGLSLTFGGFLLWIPHRWPPLIRTALFLVALACLATVCNWTAFAPNVVYDTSTSIGPVTFSGDGNVGGRIVFGLAAIVVDVIILSALVGWIRAKLKPGQ